MNTDFRVGIGYDVHTLEKGINFILGGIKIKSDYGCKSHSDGDVLIHAIVDALLGAAGKNDIGYYFSDDNNEYKNCKSVIFLEKTLDIIREFEIVNIDCIVIAQSPKLSPYRITIRENLSKICKIDQNRINIKFKTEEGLGFTGEKKGIKAISNCLLKKCI